MLNVPTYKIECTLTEINIMYQKEITYSKRYQYVGVVAIHGNNL